MAFVTIEWGENPSEQEPVRYEFNTFEEREAFLKGVNEAMGWDRWNPLDYDEPPGSGAGS